MNAIKWINGALIITMISGCATTNQSLSGAQGPKLRTSSQITETGQYAEVGIQFSTPGDFFALVSPSRWKSPVSAGGFLSWLNPGAWSDDAGRTGRILLGEVALIGGVAAAAGGGGSGGSSSSGSASPAGGAGGSAPPPPPPPPPLPVP